MRFGLLLLILFAAVSAQALADPPVKQGGPMVPPKPGHMPRWIANKLIGDAGPAQGGPNGYGVTELNLTNNTGIAPLCLNDTAITDPAGYRQTCLGSDVDGQGGSLSYADGTYTGTSLPFTVQSSDVLMLNSNIQQIAFQNLPPTVPGDVPVCVNPITGQMYQAGAGTVILLQDDYNGKLLMDDTGTYLLTATIPANSCTLQQQ